MVAMPTGQTGPTRQVDRPLRTFFLRLLWLWVIGAMGIGMLYLLFARIMTPTLQENMAQTQIYAYRGWQSTGVHLQANESAVVHAHGEWLYTPGEWNDANGHKRYLAPSFYPLSDVPGGVLIGRVGESGTVQYVGKNGQIWAGEPGMLYLRIDDDILSDNEGALQVSVEVLSDSDESERYLGD
jgi:hypothetical protein